MSKRPRAPSTGTQAKYPSYTCLRPYVGLYPHFLPNTVAEVQRRVAQGPAWIDRGLTEPKQAAILGSVPWGPGSLYAALMAEVVFSPPEEVKVKMWGKDVFIPRKQAAYGEPNSTYSFTGTTVTAKPWSAEATPTLWLLKEYVRCHFFPFIAEATRIERTSITETRVTAEAQQNRLYGILPKIDHGVHKCLEQPCSCNAHISAVTTSATASQSPHGTAEFPASYVLVNHYANGDEYMGYHSDAEGDLDARYPIVSLTLGASRPFRFQVTREISTTVVGLGPVPGEGGQQSTTSVTYTIPKGLVCEQQLDGSSLLAMNPGCQNRMKHGLPKKKGIDGPRLNLTFRVLSAEKSKRRV